MNPLPIDSADYRRAGGGGNRYDGGGGGDGGGDDDDHHNDVDMKSSANLASLSHSRHSELVNLLRLPGGVFRMT